MHPNVKHSVSRLPHRVAALLTCLSANLALACVHRGTVTLPPGASATTCAYSCLDSLLDQYLVALSRRDPTGLPLSPNVQFTENGKMLSVGEGLWRKAGALGRYRVKAIDAERHAAA